tara:strand:- start:1952 stop:3286 length:1335 start_codon:yes stop_codon:yes gene_type:complete
MSRLSICLLLRFLSGLVFLTAVIKRRQRQIQRPLSAKAASITASSKQLKQPKQHNMHSVALDSTVHSADNDNMQPDAPVVDQLHQTPVIVIGNLTVGGTGKTPLLIALARRFEQAGLTVGVMSRGYGGCAPYYPYCVSQQDPPSKVGDEALLIARAIAGSLVIAPQRRAALSKLIEQTPQVDIIFSDDGLQHTALPRQVEWVVIDGQRGLGNGLCLPAGPLREPVHHLLSYDGAFINNLPSDHQADQAQQAPHCSFDTMRQLADKLPLYPIELKRVGWYSVSNPEVPTQLLPADELKKQYPSIIALTAIGNPQRFLSILDQLGLDYATCLFPDHHLFSWQDLLSLDPTALVLTTEKDQVKLAQLLQQIPSTQTEAMNEQINQLKKAMSNHWHYLKIDMMFAEDVWQRVLTGLLAKLAPWPALVKKIKRHYKIDEKRQDKTDQKK